MALSLLILEPEGSARWWPLRPGPIRVGRGKNNDLVIVGRGVSRNHAVLELDGDRLVIQDLDSTYGTKVNGRQMRRAAVTVGDHIDIGVFRLVLTPQVVEPKRPTPPDRPAVSDRRQEYITDPGIRSRWDEPTVGLISAGDMDFGLSDGSGWDLSPVSSPTTSVPVVRRLGKETQAGEQPSDPHLGVRFVADPVAMDDPLALAGDQRPVASAVQGLATGLRHAAGPEQSSGELRALDALLTAYAVIQQLGATRTLSAFLDEALSVLLSHLGADTALIIAREKTGKLRVVSARHRGETNRDELPVSRAIVDQAISTGRPQQTSQFRSDPHLGRRPSVMAYRSGALLAVPLVLAEGCPGVAVLARRTGHPFDRMQVETVQSVAGLLGRCLQLRELERGSAEERARLAALERLMAPETADWAHEQRGHAARREDHLTVLHVVLPDLAASPLAGSADRAAEILESTRAVVQHAVSAHGGVLVSLGAISGTAVFGRGEDTSENDAGWAVAAAREMVREFGNLARHSQLPEDLALRIGLDRGPVLEVLLGPAERLVHTVLGEPVVHARRAAAALGQTGIWATEAVIASLPPRTATANRVERADSGLPVPLFEITP